ncbi:MAG TPA: DUF4272 domain-containing protein [Solirubrobacteraceae bacterium]|jgi:hypothetical protein|nr:DUF4272 domain-containing protein [Solirubrobacteraceae bacterium]
MDYVAIRERSVRKLARWQLSDPGALPLHSDEDFEWVRDAHGVAARCHAIAAALALQQGAPHERIRQALRDNDLERWLADREERFLRHLEGDAAMDDEERHQTTVDISWREEALWALLWSIELVDDMPPDELCSRDPFYERLAPDLDPANGRTDVLLRPLPELAAMLDFYYCLHWHARNAQYHGQRWDSKIAPGAVLERRRALEWLFQDVPWEDVDLGA